MHPHTLARCFDQYLVPIQGQADIMIIGIHYISPYNVHAFLNFLLSRGTYGKKGGALIFTYPCTDFSDPEQHAPHVEFVHRILPEARDAIELRQRYEATFASDPAYFRCIGPVMPTILHIPSLCGTGEKREGNT
ncbi:hypothetical protein [Pajaroellobacter abortibovis]|uniref:Uncharacterized protein n=1 Tax=Pajaroellobacter abortibovis TaxID=1882918 RepID=A0A1L6MWU5_9BACT|nr:hypothetical protein [Pajaroellobacter abortibovis]APR99991.1 hypothetical protein BCY86_04305 [Pajaroellobacter abortibovis]